MKEQNNPQLKSDVKAFWDSSPCGTYLSEYEEGTKEFFDDLERLRYSREHYNYGYWLKLLNPENWVGKMVLEVGCGVGTDIIQMAKNGAISHGIDLSETAIDLAKKRFNLYNLNGDLRVSDAESLPFPDNYFDFTYSFGVLHHTPNTPKAIEELRRVTKEDGKILVMLYHTNSIHMGTLFLRKYKNKELRNMPYSDVVNLLTEVNKSDSGPINPLTKTYTKKEVRKIFSSYNDVHVFLRYPIVPYLKSKLSANGLLGKLAGWHLIIDAKK